MFICLAFIMINVGGIELDKVKWRSYTTDYFIAMATAASTLAPDCLLLYLFLGYGIVVENNLLISRFAAPTSAGILFTMLAAAGLKKVDLQRKRKYWLYLMTWIQFY